MSSTVETLMAQMPGPVPSVQQEASISDKITVVGAGSIGISCLHSLVAMKISGDLVLIDKDTNSAQDEFNDIEHVSVYMGQPNLIFSNDYETSTNSKVIILTAGQLSDDSMDLNVLKKNVAIYKEIIPEIVAFSPKSVLVIVTEPVDIMSYIAWKISGLPPNRIIGAGCSLTSAQFRYRIAQKLGVSTNAVQAYVIGENGPNCIPVWTGVTVCGVRLRDINPLLGAEDDPEKWDELLFQDILQSSLNKVKKKSFNTYGMTTTVAKIVSVIVSNAKECLSVSTHIKGCRHGVVKDKDVFLSLPCILGVNGVCSVVRQALNEKEKSKLQQSADQLNKIQSELLL